MKQRMNRRTLLKTLVSTAVSAGLLKSGKTADAHDFKGYDTNYGVLVDLGRCVGCRSCEAACNREQGLPAPALPFDDQSVFKAEEPRRPDDGHYTVVNKYDSPLWDHPLFRKIQCNHCLEPACLTACFVNAYTKTPEGAVIYNPDVCVGCRTCMIACPFSIPAFKYGSAFEPRVMKCIFCYDTRLKNGRPPACVEACPMEALMFGNRRDLLSIARKRISRNHRTYVDHIYGEHEAGGTSWLYISPVPFEQAGFDTSVPNQPILNFVKDFLAVVPMVLTIWPGLFAGIFLLCRHRKQEQIVQEPRKNDIREEGEHESHGG